MTAFGLALRKELTSLETFFPEVVNVSGVNGGSGLWIYPAWFLGSDIVPAD
jgi:hypothetical protein